MTSHRAFRIAAALAVLIMTALPARAQAGKGLLDLNVATEAELAALPNMTPAVTKAVMDRRPFASVTEANAYLL